MYNIATYKSDEIIIVEYPDGLEIKKCNHESKGIDIISRLLSEDMSMSKLDIIYNGYPEYVNTFEKKIGESMITKKSLRD